VVKDPLLVVDIVVGAMVAFRASSVPGVGDFLPPDRNFPIWRPPAGGTRNFSPPDGDH